jgi:hypothetical protein
MACDLTTGRGKGCYDSLGGVKKVFFSIEDIGAITYDSSDTDVVQTLAGTPEYFEYDLKGSSNTFTETITKDINNGTSFYAQSLAVQFPKLTKSMHKELKLLVWASPTVIIQDYNDNYFIMGLANGADVTGGTVVTGGAKGDFAGYTLTMTAEEAAPANFLVVDIPTTTATISAVQETP